MDSQAMEIEAVHVRKRDCFRSVGMWPDEDVLGVSGYSFAAGPLCQELPIGLQATAIAKLDEDSSDGGPKLHR